MRYDIIGDVHGQADKLVDLLAHLGYGKPDGGAWFHPSRTAIFVGDFIDRGAKGVEVVRIVRDMVAIGAAAAVMGNHELNAIAWHTPDRRKPGEYLRPRFEEPWGASNRKQHGAFLDQVEGDPALHAEIVDWFLTLPLWLDWPELRVVHACWHQRYIDWLSPRLHEGRFLTRELMVDATTEPADHGEKDDANPSIFKAVEALTKGVELPLPAGHSFHDKDDVVRRRVRARWWGRDADTFRQVAHMSSEERSRLPETPIPSHARVSYEGRKPVFFGHYWMSGAPAVQSGLAACVDYSAGKGGPLVAYRFDGESPLSADHFTWVR